MKKILILFFAVITWQLCSGQHVWERKYYDEAANTFVKNLANRFILAGSKYESMLQRWYIFQADSLGKIEWDTTFIHSFNGAPKCIGATLDTGYIIAGYNYINPYFLKYNKYNRLEWETEIGIDKGWITIKAILNTENNNYMTVGGGINSIDQGLFIAKLDEKGNTLWTKMYNEIASGISIIESFDSGYFCLAGRGSLIKIKDNGDTLWTKNTLENFIATSMVKTQDSCIVISGNEFIGEDLVFTKVDKYGNSIWIKKYGKNYSYNICNSISNTYDDGFITANYTEPLHQNYSNLWIMKLDANGDSVFSIYSPAKLIPEKIIQTEDRLFVFLANNMYNSPRLIKTDSTGDVITSIPNISLLADMANCYPNPFDNELNICFDKFFNKEVKLNIYNILGVLIYSQNINTTQKITIKTSDFNSGVYFVKLKVDDEIFSSKLIKK